MRKFGLIGYPLSHSFSKKFFQEKFLKEDIRDCVYETYSFQDINELTHVLADPELEGLNVTLPHKKKVIAFLDEANEVVQAMQACNCIRIRNGKLSGYNTDVIGFEKSLVKALKPHHDKALVLGTGGAAAAVKYVLQKLNIEYKVVSRSKETNIIGYGDIDEQLISTHHLVINTTPLGMSPAVETFPPLPYKHLTPQHYLYDLVYNPELTLFLQKGSSQGATIKNGYEMLVIQAEESWKIWNE